MSTTQEIADQLRACNLEHVRAVIEPDDVVVLIDYLESQGFISPEAQAIKDAEATEESPAEMPDLSALKKDELLALADEQGIEVSKSKTKTEIVEAIKGGSE